MPWVSRSFVSSGFASVALALCAAACGGTSEPQPTRYLTVFVSSQGEIRADGQEVSFSRLEEELDTAEKAGALLLFAREPSERGRGSVAMLVLDAARRRRLQVRFCRERDCSDAIGSDGRLKPE